MTDGYNAALDTPEGRQAEQDRAQKVQDSMAADGHVVQHSGRRSFFGKPRREKFIFAGQEDVPEGEKQYLVVQKMLEGDRARYQEATTTKVVVESITKNTALGINQARDRTELILASVKDWYVFADETSMSPVPFSVSEFERWLVGAEPTDVDDLVKFIRELNPWLEEEADVDTLEAELRTVRERLEKAREREARDKSSR